MKPMDFTYVLRLSKTQMQENAFKDSVIENVYSCLLEYTAQESYRISFPDTVVLLQIQVGKSNIVLYIKLTYQLILLRLI